jgi:PAS domain S-box-containing protein
MSDPAAAPPGLPSAGAPLAALWALATPVALLDAAGHLVDGNAALSALVGVPQAQLAGLDPAQWQPAEDRALDLQPVRESLSPLRRRFIDAGGVLRWFSITLVELSGQQGARRWLALLHDQTAEHDALEQARRAEAELDQWFELSPAGMLVYDDHGLVLRSNAAFEALVERVPELLEDASPELQQLLGWQGRQRAPELVPGARPLERELLLPLAQGERRLRARLSCHESAAGSTRVMRVMAVVQDRSAEQERDIAQREVGLLMDSGSIGVATYEPGRGWLLPAAPVPPYPAPAARAEPAERPEGGAALMGVNRDRVEPGSLPEFERLQRALRQGEAVVVTYAVRHPEFGQRWLQTQVRPSLGADGRRSSSVITRDVTEQQGATLRNQQLLHEMTTILDSSPAGIAYLRGPALVRCNQRFERMLGFDGGSAAGASLEEILARSIGPLDGVRDALAALAEGRTFEAELPLVRESGQPRWYSLTVRRARADEGPAESVAVLTDITRLKTQQAELEKLARDRELMFSVSEVGIVIQRGLRIERANQAMAQLTGWSAPELATLDPAELYEDTRACVAFEARIAQGLQEDGRFRGERLLKRRDGRLVWVQVAVRQVDADDAEAGVIASFVDIDERRRARESLAAQAARTRAILDSVLVGIVTVSERGIEWMNRSARRMFAGELADFIGEPTAIVATPEPEHPLRRSWLTTLEEGTAETFECRLRGRDGREFWVAGNAVLSRGASGAREVTFALLDIERRRQAELRIAQAQASLQRVIETAPAAIALFDTGTQTVRQANQTAAGFLGPAVLAGGAVANPVLAAALAQWLAEVAASGQQAQHEWRSGEGAEARVWDCRLAPLAEPGEAEGGSSAGLVLLVASDVTEQRAAEQARLAAAIAQREVLVREVHHRIKNNLQGVAGLLLQTANKHPAVAQILTEAVGQVQAIAQVYGLQVGATGPLGLAGLVRAVAGSVQRMFGRGIEVRLEEGLEAELPESESIPLALVLNELLTNAIKHGQGGELRCSLEAQDGPAETADRGAEAVLRVVGRATLPPGFDLASHRSAVAGLGLVRALLPRRHSRFTLTQHGDEVVAEVRLLPPSVRWSPAAGAAAVAGAGAEVAAELR